VYDILIRRGQPLFRKRLLDVYGARCAITNCDAVEVLEAAHIKSHGEGGSMDTSNGLLLRADIHTLFDLGLISVDPASWKILVHQSIAHTTVAAELSKRTLRLPSGQADRPSPDALADHRTRAGL